MADREPIGAAVWADLQASTYRRRFALLCVAAWLVYEWGPGNETVTPLLISRVIGATEGPLTVWLSVVIGLVFTFVQQLLSGYTALLGFSTFTRTAQASWLRLHDRPNGPPGEWSQMGWLGRAFLCFGLGTTAVALVQIMTTGQARVRPHLRVIMASATLSALMVGAIAAVMSGLALLGRNISGLREPTDTIVKVLGCPLFWIGLIAIALVWSHLFSRRA